MWLFMALWSEVIDKLRVCDFASSQDTLDYLGDILGDFGSASDRQQCLVQEVLIQDLWRRWQPVFAVEKRSSTLYAKVAAFFKTRAGYLTLSTLLKNEKEPMNVQLEVVLLEGLLQEASPSCIFEQSQRTLSPAAWYELLIVWKDLFARVSDAWGRIVNERLEGLGKMWARESYFGFMARECVDMIKNAGHDSTLLEETLPTMVSFIVPQEPHAVTYALIFESTRVQHKNVSRVLENVEQSTQRRLFSEALMLARALLGSYHMEPLQVAYVLSGVFGPWLNLSESVRSLVYDSIIELDISLSITLAHWACCHDKQGALDESMKRWTASQKGGRDEVYLSCVLLLSSTGVGTLTLPDTFMQAVSNRLSLLDPFYRALAMLVAERLVSRSTIAVPLTFGDFWQSSDPAVQKVVGLSTYVDANSERPLRAVDDMTWTRITRELGPLVRKSGTVISFAEGSVQEDMDDADEILANGFVMRLSMSDQRTEAPSQPRSKSLIQVIDDIKEEKEEPVPDRGIQITPDYLEALGSDDPTLYASAMPKNNRIGSSWRHGALRPPVYIRELCMYLRGQDPEQVLADRKDEDIGPDEQAQRVQLALGTGARLVHDKAGTLELEENAVELAFALMGLDNVYDLERFDESKAALLVMTMSASRRMDAAVAVVEQIFTSRYSMIQRQELLRCLMETLHLWTRRESGKNEKIEASNAGTVTYRSRRLDIRIGDPTMRFADANRLTQVLLRAWASHCSETSLPWVRSPMFTIMYGGTLASAAWSLQGTADYCETAAGLLDWALQFRDPLSTRGTERLFIVRQADPDVLAAVWDVLAAALAVLGLREELDLFLALYGTGRLRDVYMWAVELNEYADKANEHAESLGRAVAQSIKVVAIIEKVTM